ncbi:MAG: hypothetical protein DMD25_11780 [Gemmatimonadetes bacterium]|nr:MAG: hypothetical protein DMD25_11780 [Gemmatimonadota bacterium]
MSEGAVRVGVISDTHGLLRPEVFDVFKKVDHILHAGDVGGAQILIELEALAPVTAVYGNADPPELRARLPQVAHLELDGFVIVVRTSHSRQTARSLSARRNHRVWAHA